MTRNLSGLSDKEIEISRSKNGSNILERKRTKGFFRKFLENLNDPIIKILIIALFVEIIFTLGNCNFFEIGGIVIAILIATTVSTASEFRSERAFFKMQERSRTARVRVYRNGALCEISADDIVVGDIILLSAGEHVQADSIIINGKVKVDQSALNGESKEVTKKAGKFINNSELSNPSLVFRGSVITVGDALARVISVGVNTFYGMVARDVQSETRKSPLKLRLAEFASQISKIGYVMALIVGITYLWTAVVASNGYIWKRIVEDLSNVSFVISTLSHALTLMITVIVVAAPEGLPMMITVVLSANMKKMLKDGVIVKKLVGIETAGSMNILFTDKTGTLTTGRLECDKIICGEESYSTVSALKKEKELYQILLQNSKFNTLSEISNGEVIGGNSTEQAISAFFKKEVVAKTRIIDKLPFSSENKYSYVRLEGGREIIKGAPEVIISRCDKIYREGAIDRKKLSNRYYSLAANGTRVIAIAYKEAKDSGYVFLCFVVLKDRLRLGVRDAVLGVQRAGVQVVMLTGDGAWGTKGGCSGGYVNRGRQGNRSRNS